jgi:hypothetical protein
MIKSLKKQNNEIIIQYLTDSTVIKDEPPVVGVVTAVSFDNVCCIQRTLR